MKTLKNYWFLQDPIDIEHKFYVLMDFLQSVENDMEEKRYDEQVQKIRRIHEDLKIFKSDRSLSNRTLGTMTKEEIDQFEELQGAIQKKESEVVALVDNSIGIMETFLQKINPVIDAINQSIRIYTNDDIDKFKDQGFLVLRIPSKRKIKIYSWMFSFIKVRKKDQIGISITELLDPLPKYTKSDKKIIHFFGEEIKVYNPEIDSFIFADLVLDKDAPSIGFDLMKERGIQFIVESYKKYLS